MSKQTTKKVSITAIDKVMKEMKREPVTIDWHGTEIIVKPEIDLKDALSLVRTVADSCFSDSGEYMPELYTYVLRGMTIELYTNVSLPANAEHKYEILIYSDLYDCVYKAIENKRQYANLCNSIDARIDAMSEANNMENTRKINALIAELSKLMDSMTSMFNGISNEDLTSFVKTVSESGSFDEGKIVSAYLDHRKAEREAEEVEAQQYIGVTKDEP